jgi:membrane-associated phospholipid phosphatase
MHTRARFHIIITIILILLIIEQQAWCTDSAVHSFATAASNSIAPYLVIGELSLLGNGKKTKPELIQGAKTLLTTAILTEALKYAVAEKRPNSNSRSSFPSGHTSAAFAIATVVTDYKPKLALLAYGTAATIGWSRVEVGAHHWWDVLAGAGLGYFTAKHFTNKHIVLTGNGVGYVWRW